MEVVDVGECVSDVGKRNGKIATRRMSNRYFLMIKFGKKGK